MHACIHTYILACMHACRHTCSIVYICIDIYIYIHRYVFAYVYVYIYIHIISAYRRIYTYRYLYTRCRYRDVYIYTFYTHVHTLCLCNPYTKTLAELPQGLRAASSAGGRPGPRARPPRSRSARPSEGLLWGELRAQRLSEVA